MPREIVVPVNYEVIEEGKFKGCCGFRCQCGRLIIFGKEGDSK